MSLTVEFLIHFQSTYVPHWIKLVKYILLLLLLLISIISIDGTHSTDKSSSPNQSSNIRWTLVDNFNFYNNSYILRWHSHRHPHLNESSDQWFYGSVQAETTTKSIQRSRFRPIHIVVLAPSQSTEEYSLSRIAPAILAAARSIEAEARINKNYAGWEHGAQIDFVDTKCSSAIGPLVAFDYFIRNKVDVFLGPVCPYVLAPVARYTSFWDVPHLTSSGQVSMFDDKNSTFRILTRMNGSFSRMGQFFNQVRNFVQTTFMLK